MYKNALKSIFLVIKYESHVSKKKYYQLFNHLNY